MKVPSSLAAYPRDDEIAPALEKVLKRARLTADNIEIADKEVIVKATSKRAISEKAVRYFDRSDLFKQAAFSNFSADKKSVTITAKIDRIHFYFGTDANGRDLLTRTLIAGRISLIIGLLASGVALLIGVTYGSLSGYFGGQGGSCHDARRRCALFAALHFLRDSAGGLLRAKLHLDVHSVGAVEWLDMARIVRGQTLSIKRQEYVLAAEAMGVGAGGILRRHIIPNTLGPVVIFVTLLVPKVILLESFLSFLGLGVQEPMTSWGVLISEGARNLQGASWMLIFPIHLPDGNAVCTEFHW